MLSWKKQSDTLISNVVSAYGFIVGKQIFGRGALIGEMPPYILVSMPLAESLIQPPLYCWSEITGSLTVSSQLVFSSKTAKKNLADHLIRMPSLTGFRKETNGTAAAVSSFSIRIKFDSFTILQLTIW